MITSMNTARILIIDDDIELCTLLKKCLETENYEVAVEYIGSSGLGRAKKEEFELIILDVMLPGMDGIKVLGELRKLLNTPVLMLSAKGQEMDKVLGLKAGADDYLSKPFSLSELIARVNSLIRRFTKLGGQDVVKSILDFGELQIDLEKHSVIKNGNDLSLTAKELGLVRFLASHPDQVFSKKQIYQNVWQEDYVYDDNNIMALIRRTRKKIEDNPESPVYIQTVWGIGYRFHSHISTNRSIQENKNDK